MPSFSCWLWQASPVALNNPARTKGKAAKAPTAPPGINWPSPPLPDGPIVLDTGIQHQIRLIVTKGLNQPFSMAFLPDGDILITERPGRLRIVRNGVLDPNPVAGVPASTGARLGRADGSGAASSLRGEPAGLLYVSQTGRARQRHRETMPGSSRWPAADGMAHALTDVRDLFLRHPERQRLADRLRKRRDGLHDRGRRRSTCRGRRAGSEQSRRQGSAAARRRNGSAGQSVRRTRGLSSRDLHAGSSQRVGTCGPARHWRHLGMRERTQRRRRNQYSSAGQELRMARGQLRAVLSGPARFGESVARRNGAAASLLGAGHRDFRYDLLHRRQVPQLEEQSCSSAACGRAKFRAPAIWSASISTTSGRSSTASRCCASFRIESGMFGKVPTVFCTC